MSGLVGYMNKGIDVKKRKFGPNKGEELVAELVLKFILRVVLG